MNSFKPIFLKSSLWEFSQVIIGADEAKQQLHYSTLMPPKGAKILDFGCSTGNASAIFLDYDYTGIDIDPLVIDFANYKFRKHPNMKFICTDVMTFNKPHYFDYIIFGAAGHHIPYTQCVQIFNQFKELLKPSGSIGVFDPVKTGTESSVLKFVMSIDQGKFHKTYDEYLQLFKECHLTVETQKISDLNGPLLNYTNYAAFKLTNPLI